MPVERFKQLQAGDVLFIDTSHVIKAQNDVEYELLRVLPSSLNAGVVVHIHDIFTPYDYPAEWLVGSLSRTDGGNNEQYALRMPVDGGGEELGSGDAVHFLLMEGPRRMVQAAHVGEYDHRPASVLDQESERATHLMFAVRESRNRIARNFQRGCGPQRQR